MDLSEWMEARAESGPPCFSSTTRSTYRRDMLIIGSTSRRYPEDSKGSIPLRPNGTTHLWPVAPRLWTFASIATESTLLQIVPQDDRGGLCHGYG